MAKTAQKNPVYTLDVELISGPTTVEFWEKNPMVLRKIKIRSRQKLALLHEVIFDAFDRDEEHMYEFQVGGKKPGDRAARSYGLQAKRPMMMWRDATQEGDVKKTSIGDLELKAGQVMFYWFDFGDDWWHKIKVVGIDEDAPSGQYPMIVERIGDSPPQYLCDDEECDENEEDIEDEEDDA
jgi:hypothetical protein